MLRFRKRGLAPGYIPRSYRCLVQPGASGDGRSARHSVAAGSGLSEDVPIPTARSYSMAGLDVIHKT